MLTCQRCGTSFYRYRSDVNKAAQRGATAIYCSKACEIAAKANDVDCVCERCGEAFTVWASRVSYNHAHGIGAARFCSAKCRDSANADVIRPSGGRGKWGFRDDIGRFVRSSWEANVCRFLRLVDVPYEYEPRSFRLPSGVAYRPDLLAAGSLWIEVKGWMNASSAAKITEFRAAYPEETLLVLDKDAYRALERAVSSLIPTWE